MRYDLVYTGLGTVIATLVVLAPIGYVTKQNLPPQVVVVDVQKLINDEQNTLLKQFNNGDPVHMSDDAKDKATKHAGDFAHRLSVAIDQIGTECNCVVINKAAVLSGAALDYTQIVSDRIGK
jgi:hypothetical protein